MGSPVAAMSTAVVAVGVAVGVVVVVAVGVAVVMFGCVRRMREIMLKGSDFPEDIQTIILRYMRINPCIDQTDADPHGVIIEWPAGSIQIDKEALKQAEENMYK